MSKSKHQSEGSTPIKILKVIGLTLLVFAAFILTVVIMSLVITKVMLPSEKDVADHYTITDNDTSTFYENGVIDITYDNTVWDEQTQFTTANMLSLAYKDAPSEYNTTLYSLHHDSFDDYKAWWLNLYNGIIESSEDSVIAGHNAWTFSVTVSDDEAGIKSITTTTTIIELGKKDVLRIDLCYVNDMGEETTSAIKDAAAEIVYNIHPK